MRLLCKSLGIVLALSFSACAVDETKAPTEETSAPPQNSDQDTQRSEQALTPAGDGATTNACHVVWHLCRDPFNNDHPSFCTNGECGGNGAAEAATLCNQNCNGVDCNPGNLVQLSSGC